MTEQQQIDAFLSGSPIAVVGASQDRSKYGNKVFRAYLQNQRSAIPVNPKADVVEGVACSTDLSSLPEPAHGVSVITPPKITEAVVEEAGRLGIQHVWLQPGAESEQAVDRARELGINVIAGGPCVLVVLGFREDE